MTVHRSSIPPRGFSRRRLDELLLRLFSFFFLFFFPHRLSRVKGEGCEVTTETTPVLS